MMLRNYVKEVSFYRELVGDLTIRTPRVYYADIDDTGVRFVLLMQDMAPAAAGRPADRLHTGRRARGAARARRPARAALGRRGAEVLPVAVHAARGGSVDVAEHAADAVERLPGPLRRPAERPGADAGPAAVRQHRRLRQRRRRTEDGRPRRLPARQPPARPRAGRRLPSSTGRRSRSGPPARTSRTSSAPVCSRTCAANTRTSSSAATTTISSRPASPASASTSCGAITAAGRGPAW